MALPKGGEAWKGKSKDLDSGSVNKRSNELAFAHKQPILSARLISTGLIPFFSPHSAELLRASTHETKSATDAPPDRKTDETF